MLHWVFHAFVTSRRHFPKSRLGTLPLRYKVWVWFLNFPIRDRDFHNTKLPLFAFKSSYSPNYTRRSLSSRISTTPSWSIRSLGWWKKWKILQSNLYLNRDSAPSTITLATSPTRAIGSATLRLFGLYYSIKCNSKSISRLRKVFCGLLVLITKLKAELNYRLWNRNSSRHRDHSENNQQEVVQYDRIYMKCAFDETFDVKAILWRICWNPLVKLQV